LGASKDIFGHSRAISVFLSSFRM